MPDFEILSWHWWIIAIVLMMIEIMIPGAFFLWIGIAAAFVGGLVFLIPSLNLVSQVFIFGGASILSIWVGQKYLKRYTRPTDQPNLNRRGEYYIGRTLILTEPIVNGQGRVKIEDSFWKITGEDCPIGMHVRVTGVQGGSVLQIKVIDSTSSME
jgi:hypothetical protein